MTLLVAIGYDLETSTSTTTIIMFEAVHDYEWTTTELSIAVWYWRAGMERGYLMALWYFLKATNFTYKLLRACHTVF